MTDMSDDLLEAIAVAMIEGARGKAASALRTAVADSVVCVFDRRWRDKKSWCELCSAEGKHSLDKKVVHKPNCPASLVFDAKRCAEIREIEQRAKLAADMTDDEYFGLLRSATHIWYETRNETIANRMLKMIMSLPDHVFGPTFAHRNPKGEAEGMLMIALGGHSKYHFISKYKLYHLAKCERCGAKAEYRAHDRMRGYWYFACETCRKSDTVDQCSKLGRSKDD